MRIFRVLLPFIILPMVAAVLFYGKAPNAGPLTLAGLISDIVAFVYVTGASFGLIVLLEYQMIKQAKGGLSAWRRMFIGLPIMLLLAANIDGILSLNAYVAATPGAYFIRYPGDEMWNTDRFFYAGMAAGFLCPFLLKVPFKKLPMGVASVWVVYVVWMFFVFTPFLLLCGVPLQD